MPRGLRHTFLFGVVILWMSVPIAWAEKPKPGESVNNLQLTVTSDSSRWDLGSSKEFQAVLKNVGDTPVIIDTFGDLNERFSVAPQMSIAFETFSLGFHQAKTGKPVLGPALIYKGQREFSSEQCLSLAPGVTYEKPLHFTLENFPPGQYELIISYHPGSWCERPLSPEQVWGRFVISNPVAMEVVKASQE